MNKTQFEQAFACIRMDFSNANINLKNGSIKASYYLFNGNIVSFFCKGNTHSIDITLSDILSVD